MVQVEARSLHGLGPTEDIEALLKRLNLEGKKVHGVKIGGERSNDVKEEVRWLAPGRVHMKKSFAQIHSLKTCIMCGFWLKRLN